MNYTEYDSEFKKENARLKLAISIVFVLMAVITIFVGVNRQVFVYKGSDVFEERILSSRVCEEGAFSIFKGRPNSLFVSKGVMELTNKTPFVIPIEKILVIESLEERACRIIFESEGSLLSFKVTLLEDSSFPFNYKVNQIDELHAPKEVL
jgi:hypothetical protein